MKVVDRLLEDDDPKWMQHAVKKPGELHKDLGIPQDEPISDKQLKAAEKRGGKIAQRANFALRARGESIVKRIVRRLVEDGPMLTGVPEKFKKNYKGWDADVELPDEVGKFGAHSFEFEKDSDMKDFLDTVGGAPHPLGGRRVILAK